MFEFVSVQTSIVAAPIQCSNYTAPLPGHIKQNYTHDSHALSSCGRLVSADKEKHKII